METRLVRIAEIANQIQEDKLYFVNGNLEEPCALIAQARFWEGGEHNLP